MILDVLLQHLLITAYFFALFLLIAVIDRDAIYRFYVNIVFGWHSLMLLYYWKNAKYDP